MFINFARQYAKQGLMAASAFGVGVAALGSTSTATSLDANNSKKVVVVGGGTGGVGVTAMLKREGIKDVTIVEPSSTHYYQPLWTLVGGGVKDVQKSARPMKDVIANTKCDKWIQKRLKSFDPKNNQVILEDGTKLDYDYLVVAAGIQIDWDKVPGLTEGVEKEDSGVVSIYDYKFADKTWKTFENVALTRTDKPKNLIFTMSPTGIKCAGAPMKIMFLSEDMLRRQGMRDTANITYFTPAAGMFGVKYYADKLQKIREDRSIDAKFQHELVSIDVAQKVATFQNKATNEKVKQPYDMIHVAPHMSAPDFIKKSPIADDNGWVDVDMHTMQSKKFKNIFALGDCCNSPNSKTAAAITSQAPVLVHNLTRAMQGLPVDAKYNGYASCPLIIARGKTILAEFGYGGKLMETFSRDTGSFPLKHFGTEGYLQQRFFYFLKETLFPYVYWNLWTRGLWYGTTGPIRPTIEKIDRISNKN